MKRILLALLFLVALLLGASLPPQTLYPIAAHYYVQR